MGEELKTLLILSVRASLLWPAASDGKWMRGRPDHFLYAIPMSSEHPLAIHGSDKASQSGGTVFFPASGRLGEVPYPNHPPGVGAVAQAMFTGNSGLEHPEGPDLPSLSMIKDDCEVDCIGAKAVVVGTFSGKGAGSMDREELLPMLALAALELAKSSSLQGARFMSEDGSPRLIEIDLGRHLSVSGIASVCDDLRLRAATPDPATPKSSFRV